MRNKVKCGATLQEQRGKAEGVRPGNLYLVVTAVYCSKHSNNAEITPVIFSAFVRIFWKSINSCKEKLLAPVRIIPFYNPANSLEMAPKCFTQTNALIVYKLHSFIMNNG